MSIALFNGCSFVWGDELQDPMKSRFSKLFADQTGMEEVNLSICGASNSRIYRTTIDWIQSNGMPDVMIIVWSGIDRFEYIDPVEKDRYDEYYLQCSPSRIDQEEFYRKKRALRSYMTEITSDYKSSVDTINYMCEVQHLCELTNTPLLQYQFASRHKYTVMTNIESKRINERDTAFIEYYKSKLDYLKPYSTYGLLDDNDLLGLSMEIGDVEISNRYYGHPLEKSQIMFKDIMIKELEKHYDFRIQ